ncbi:MAG: hypothetical protein GY710_03145 [Desulfobacteraceae bacterium]|nr:hypothetical protein [Desulfobacteraceae bacterium]
MKLTKLKMRGISRVVAITLSIVFLLIPEGMTKNVASQEAKHTLTENKFIMAAPRPADSPLFKFWLLIYSEIFRRLDIQLDLIYFPAKRASQEADEGKVDGEPARIYSYAFSHPKLIRVEEPTNQINVVAYVADPSISKLKGWDSLRNTDYLIEYTRGAKLVHDNLTKVVKEKNLSNVTNTSQGLERLALNRIDVFVDNNDVIMPLLHDPKFGLHGKIRMAGHMASMPLYMYMHKKHLDLVPQVVKIIKAVKAEGLVEHYRKIAFGVCDDEE